MSYMVLRVIHFSVRFGDKIGGQALNSREMDLMVLVMAWRKAYARQ